MQMCVSSSLLSPSSELLAPKNSFLEYTVSFLQSNWSILSKWPRLQNSHWKESAHVQ